MSKKYPEYAYAGGSMDFCPDFNCPICNHELEWPENAYPFKKEWIKCGNCEGVFAATKKIKEFFIIHDE